MKYQVILTPEAEANIASAFDYIYQRSPMNATRWIRGLYSRIETFEEFPSRSGIARETKQGGEDLRQFIYFSHRIIFRIEEENGIVRILHVRHGAQRAMVKCQKIKLPKRWNVQWSGSKGRACSQRMVAGFTLLTSRVVC